MATRILTPAVFALLLASAQVYAAGGNITITSPMNGAQVSPHDQVELNYEAVLGPDGDHLHLYVDGKRIDVIRPVKGMATVGMLPPGNHHVCLEVNTKAHVPTGVERCVDLISK